jgi:hypothetical protein
MKQYKVLVNIVTHEKAKDYLVELQSGEIAGDYLQTRLDGQDLASMTVCKFIEVLMNTKRPQIFAESAIHGDGSDWSLKELSILGDIGIATPITVYDNGKHFNPDVYDNPFKATLLFTPGALLRSSCNTPADLDEVTDNGIIDSNKYYALYERRLLPLFIYANQIAKQNNKQAFVTIPGLGCGQFAGKFMGQLGVELKKSLMTLLNTHGNDFSNIKAVYYDPYQECENERHEIHGIPFLVRPLLKGNDQKPQLCYPKIYEEVGDDFSECELFSLVAWDHVSWPGNDFYAGARATDDGVKAAATNSMYIITGVEGAYDEKKHCYCPPSQYRTWREVIVKNNIQLEVEDTLFVFGGTIKN